jgi:FkbM family methyltransferase
MAADQPTPWTPSPDVPLAIVRARHGWMAYNPHDLYIGRSIERYGEFGEAELDVMRLALPPGGVVFDVGANIGTHAVAFARHVGPSGMVFSFEPQRVVHGILQTNATLNGLTAIHAVHAAVGKEPGQLLVPDFVYGNEGNYGAIAMEPAERGWPVRVVTLDEYLWVPRCDLVKIDVEGMEPDVLDGGRAFLERFRPVLFVENDRARTSEAVLSRLLAAGYRVYWHIVPLYRAGNWRGDAENIFGNTGTINVLCIPREREQNVVGLPEVLDATAPPPQPLAPY